MTLRSYAVVKTATKVGPGTKGLCKKKRQTKFHRPVNFIRAISRRGEFNRLHDLMKHFS